MSEPVGSTSWPNRHRTYFVRLNELLRERRPGQPPLIAIIGPGAVTRFCRPFLHDAARQASRLRLLVGDAARYADQLLRRIPFLSLVSLEPLEVENVLTVTHRLAVVDISPRVLAAVRRQLPDAAVYCVDLAAAPLPFQADVIIAFNVISRIGGASAEAETSECSAALAMRNLASALPPGGLLLADDRSTSRYLPEGQFEQISEKTHRKTAMVFSRT